MNIETLLREATHTHASETGPPLRRVHELAPVARSRARRRRTRHLLAGAATAVAAVAAGVVTVPQLVEPTGNGPAVLAPASYSLPAFPYTPGWVPDGVAEPHVLLWTEVPDLAERDIVVDHVAADGEPANVLIRLRILSSAGDDDQSSGQQVEDVVVRDAPGVLTSDGDWLSVIWTDPAGRLVEAGASAQEVGRAGLLRYVEELVERPLPVTPPVALATAPVGSEVDTVQPFLLGLRLPDGTWLTLMVHDPAKVDQLHADLRSSPDYHPSPPVAVELAGRPAQLVDIGEGQLALSISFGSDLMLTIGPWRHDQQSLLAFAEGATLTRYALPEPLP